MKKFGVLYFARQFLHLVIIMVRRKPGLAQVKKCQKHVGLFISKAPVRRLAREKLDCIQETGVRRICADVFLPLQKAMEGYMVQLFDEAGYCVTHGSRTTLMPKDLVLAVRLRDDWRRVIRGWKAPNYSTGQIQIPRGAATTISRPAIIKLTRAGGLLRTSEAVVFESRNIMGWFVKNIIEKAAVFAEYADRITIKKADIMRALHVYGIPIYFEE